MKAQPRSPRSSQRNTTSSSAKSTLLCCALAALSTPAVMAQQCVSLQGSTTCPAFNESSISTDSALRGPYPFLAYVSDASTFDTQFTQYIATAYAQEKYQQLLGCSSVNLTNTTDLYARYTATFLCNAIVQQSIQACGLTGNAARPVCADTCADFAQSEESIASTPAICGNTSADALQLIRADFTTCALPSDSLSTDCITGAQNEPDNCGFSDNLGSLCAYCAASSPNATDSCCLFSNTETRCAGVKLPITTTMGSIYSSTSSPVASATASSASNHSRSGLSGGDIAGIVVGSVVGALLLLAAIIACCIFARRRRESQRGSIFNQPSPSRQGPVQQMAYTNGRTTQAAEVLPVGARVHQMTALEGASTNGEHSSPIAGGGYGSSGYDDTPESQRSGLGVAAVGKRGGSLREDHSSPGSGEEYSSPEGLASGQSEQMSHFKDYYSQDDIRPNDTVAVLWAYQPRANDEWELERGDMLKVVGIWDDGWATGVKIRERAEEWEARRQGNRDSGVSNGSARRPMSTEPVADGEIKAFPLVCVCLPQHWRKTIEGDTAERGPSGEGPGSP